MLICVVGRSCSGKDYVGKQICDILGYKMICSYTTRKKRANEENGREHWFVSKIKMWYIKTFKKKDIIAYSKIGKYEYCGLLRNKNDGGVYIIDPNGLKTLNPNIKKKIIYVYCDEYERNNRAKKRSDYNKFSQRNLAEDSQFKEFEVCNSNWDMIIDTTENKPPFNNERKEILKKWSNLYL